MDPKVTTRRVIFSVRGEVCATSNEVLILPKYEVRHYKYYFDYRSKYGCCVLLCGTTFTLCVPLVVLQGHTCFSSPYLLPEEILILHISSTMIEEDSKPKRKRSDAHKQRRRAIKRKVRFFNITRWLPFTKADWKVIRLN
jgi:hypothetical protein